MGEAKRRKELGIPPRDKNLKDTKEEDRYIHWLPLTKISPKFISNLNF